MTWLHILLMMVATGEEGWVFQHVQQTTEPVLAEVTLQVTFERLSSSLDKLAQHYLDVGLFEDLEALHALNLRDIAYGLEVVEVLPEPTGQPNPYALELEPTGEGQDYTCEDYLCASLPTGGFNSQQSTSPSGGTTETWTTDDGSTHFIHRDADGYPISSGSYTEHPDGSSTYVEHFYHFETESTTTVRATFDADGNMQEFSVEEQTAGQPPAGDIAEMPAEDQSGLCPMVLDVCQRLAEEVAEQMSDPQRHLIVGVLVNPAGPEEPEEAPPLWINPEDLVINPDPNNVEGSQSTQPREVRMQVPVIVLPPKPG